MNAQNFLSMILTKIQSEKFENFLSVLKNWQKLNKTKSLQEIFDECVFRFDYEIYEKVRKFNAGEFPEKNPPELLSEFLEECLDPPR